MYFSILFQLDQFQSPEAAPRASPRVHTLSSALALQRLVGNAAVARALPRPVPKVVSKPQFVAQRACTTCAEAGEEAACAAGRCGGTSVQRDGPDAGVADASSAAGKVVRTVPPQDVVILLGGERERSHHPVSQLFRRPSSS